MLEADMSLYTHSNTYNLYLVCMKRKQCDIVMAGDTFIRHWQRFQEFPYRLAALSNPLCPDDLAETIGRDFISSCPQCLDPGFSRALQSRTGTARSTLRSTGLLSKYWRRVITDWVKMVDVTTYELEIEHANNRNSTQVRFAAVPL